MFTVDEWIGSVNEIKYTYLDSSKKKKEDFENLINSSPLFEMDKESSFDGYKCQYQKVFYPLTEVIYLYYHQFYFGDDLVSDTLFKKVTTAIKNYKKERGPFVNYLNSFIISDLKGEIKKEQIEQVRLVKISKKDDESIRKFIKYAKSKGLDIKESETLKSIAEHFNVEVNMVQEAIEINFNAVTISEEVLFLNKNDDEKVVNVIDKQQIGRGNIEDDFVSKDRLAVLVKKINKEFLKRRKVLQEKLSMLLTVQIIKDCNEDIRFAASVLYGTKMCRKEIFEFYDKNGRLPTRIEIGNMIGMQAKEKSIEAKLSKVLSGFMKEIKGIYNE